MFSDLWIFKPKYPNPPKSFPEVNMSSFVVEDQNKSIKKSMEDFTISELDLTGNKQFSLFVILDGHGGHEIASFCKVNYPTLLRKALTKLSLDYSVKNAIKDSVAELVESLPSPQKNTSGTTFCGVLINNRSMDYYTINIGDSRAYRVIPIKSVNPKINCDLELLTTDHNLKNKTEKERIIKAEGLFSNRVGGQLMVTRSVGDCSLADYGVLAEPDVVCRKFKNERYLILGSDGIWDYIEIETVIEIFTKYSGKEISLIAKDVMKTALEKSVDNLSLILVSIK